MNKPAVTLVKSKDAPQGLFRWLSSHRLFVLFIFVGAVFIYLAYLGEQRTRQVQHIQNEMQSQNYQGCLQGNISATRFNTLLDQLIAVEKSNQFAPKTLVNQRIAAYQSAKIDLFDCSKVKGPHEVPAPPLVPFTPSTSASPTTH